MTERGIVLRNLGNEIEIQMQPSDACGSCSACFLDAKKMQILRLKNTFPVNPGDQVELEVNPAQTLQSAFLLFFLPLISMVLGYFLFLNYVNIPGMLAIYQGFLGAVSAIAVTFVCIHFYDKYLQKSGAKEKIRIVKIIQ